MTFVLVYRLPTEAVVEYSCHEGRSPCQTFGVGVRRPEFLYE